MAEVAALYTVETAVEGAAVGAFAVSQSTVPLHTRFRKLETPIAGSAWKPTTAHSLNVVKGKAYIFGGDTDDGESTNHMRVITLPYDVENGVPDYQLIEPVFESDRPLQQYSIPSPATDSQGFEEAPVSGENQSSQRFQSRSSHASTSIGHNIFILAGGKPNDSKTGPDQAGSETQLFHCDQMYSFSTQTNKWSIIQANIEKCKDGVPAPRTGASCTSTPHPQPESGIEITIHAHGTIFLHGGYSVQGQSLRDTWAFDVSSRAWSRLPDIPDPQPEEIAGEGRITCIHERLWRVGDGFGKMMYLDFEVTHGTTVGETSGPHHGEVSIKPKETKWETLSFGDKAPDTAPQDNKAGQENQLIHKSEHLPVPRQNAGFFPVTTGAGRLYLLYFMGQDGPGSILGDIWSFQIKAEQKSSAAVKDFIRGVIGRKTGENQWARCEVIESTKDEGQVYPLRGLTGFAADTWRDLGGGNVVIWGGIDSQGRPSSDCWVMSVE